MPDSSCPPAPPPPTVPLWKPSPGGTWQDETGDATSVPVFGDPGLIVPTVADAEERLTALREHGPWPFAFTLAAPLPAPAGPAE